MSLTIYRTIQYGMVFVRTLVLKPIKKGQKQ